MSIKKQVFLCSVMGIMLLMSILLSVHIGGKTWLVFLFMLIGWWTENHMNRLNRINTEKIYDEAANNVMKDFSVSVGHEESEPTKPPEPVKRPIYT